MNYVVKSVPSDSFFCVKFHRNVKSKDAEQIMYYINKKFAKNLI